MQRYSAVFMLMVLGTGCMHDKKPETQPPPVAATPPVTQPPEGRKQPAKGTKAAPATAAKKPASTAKPKPAAAALATAKTTPPKAATGTLDLDALKTRLKDTKAIGVMTKLSLKNQVDDLLDKFRKHYAGKATPTIADLRRSYDMLMMKVLSLLQDDDQKLASDILSSRERIWGLLADPKSFAAVTA